MRARGVSSAPPDAAPGGDDGEPDGGDGDTTAPPPLVVAAGRLPTAAAGLLAGLCAAAIWGGGAVVSRHLVANGEVAVADLIALRYLGTFPIALALTLVQRRSGWRAWPLHRMAILLLLAGPPYHFLLTAGYAHASAGTGALLVSAWLPAFAIALACVFGHTRQGWATRIGSLVLVGLGLFCLAGGSAAPSSTTATTMTTMTGTGFVIFTSAAAIWASLNHLVHRWRISPADLTLMLGVTAPLFLPVWWSAGTGPVPDVPLSGAMLQIAYHGIATSIAATYLFFAAIRLAGPMRAAFLQATAPAFAVGLGAALLAEPLTPPIVIATLLIVAGVAISALAQPAARRDA